MGVLGLRNSGKSRTWNTLFGRNVRTGLHWLSLGDGERVQVFLIAGSPEERGEHVKDILKKQSCPIVLCSMQYVDAVKDTLDFFIESKFLLYVQWLSPAYGRYPVKTFDFLGLGNKILSARSVFSIRSAHRDPNSRAREIREFIYGWAQSRRLLVPS